MTPTMMTFSRTMKPDERRLSGKEPLPREKLRNLQTRRWRRRRTTASCASWRGRTSGRGWPPDLRLTPSCRPWAKFRDQNLMLKIKTLREWRVRIAASAPDWSRDRCHLIEFLAPLCWVDLNNIDCSHHPHYNIALKIQSRKIFWRFQFHQLRLFSVLTVDFNYARNWQ